MSGPSQLEGIAVIGMAGRFPMASGVEQFWSNLEAGKDCSSDFTVEELVDSGVPRQVAESPRYVRRCPVLEHPTDFDPNAFGYSPKEAEVIDPQQRILLECAWEALEQAGHDPHRFGGSIGVWAGCGVPNYFMKYLLSLPEHFEALSNFNTIVGNDKDYVASRIAYKLDLRGPAVAVQTACSSSLVAVHMACQALLTYQCDMALAGGVSLQYPRARGHFIREGEIFSPDGICRAFDKAANGTVIGEGCGLVVLRRLEDALDAGDMVLAVIRGSAVNNDGSSKAGFTAPAVTGQAELIAMAQAAAGVQADDISYVEAHGTGTPLGDTIEVAALTQAFRHSTQERAFCGLGAVKPSIGHLDVAAGIAGLIKTVCALTHKKLPATLNFTEASPDLHLPESPFYIVDRLIDWEPRHGRRIAGVSSFGLGGTNAHVVVEEFHASRRTLPSRSRWQVLPISAATETALQSSCRNVAAYIESHGPDLNLPDLAFTLTMGRQSLRQRLCVVADSVTSAAATLHSQDQLFTSSGKAGRTDSPVVFLFSGQGTQYQGMALGLFRESRVFRESMERCSQIVGPIEGGQSLLDTVYGGAEAAGAFADQTAVAQPLLFAIEYSLARLWESYGVRPAAVAGHSSGELVAACEAGVFSLDEGLLLARERGRLMQSMEPGAMVAVPLPEAEVRALLPPALDVAVINAPLICEVSGPVGDVEAFVRSLEGRGVHCRALHTSHAFHSRMMEKAANEFAGIVQRVSRNAPRIPLTSNLTGGWISDEECVDPFYWSRHIRNMVRFSDNLMTIAERFESATLLEVGPGNTLCSISRQNSEPVSSLASVSCVRHPKQHVPDEAFFLRSVGALWCHGVGVDVGALFSGERRNRIHLPSYPFERQQLCIIPPKYRSVAGKGKDVATRAGSRKIRVAQQKRDRRVREQRVLSIEGLMDLWRDLLGVPSIKPEDNFFDLGGHSLLAAQMFAQIKSKFGLNRPVSVLLDSPTVGGLFESLSRSTNHQWRPLVPIESRGRRMPLFLVHGAEGNVLLYRELAGHLQPDQPVFGLQCKGLDGRGTHHTRIEEMAAEYVSAIEEAYPRGPLLLGGYCMGGMVALEMAQRLRQRGREIPLVLMLESYNYRGCGVHVSRSLEAWHSIQNIWYHIRNLVMARGGEGWAFLAKKARLELSRAWTAMEVGVARLGGKLHITMPVELPHLRISKVNDAAYFRYRPAQYDGAIAVFRPRSQFAGYDKPDCGWGAVARGRIEVHTIPSSPRGMLLEPYVIKLAGMMRESIERAPTSNA